MQVNHPTAIAVVDAENYNVEEVVKILQEVHSISALETKKPDADKKA